MTGRARRPLCGGLKRDGSGGTCTRPAGWGTPSTTGACKLHGGSTRTHVVAAQREQALQAATTYGLPVDVDPRDALLQEVHRSAGIVAWLAERVAELEPEAVVWGTAQVKERQVPIGEDGDLTAVSETTLKAVVNVWVLLYQQERRHLREVCRDAIAAGIAERQVQLAERQGALLVGVIRAVLGDLNLSPEQAAMVTDIVPRRLRAVSGGVDVA